MKGKLADQILRLPTILLQDGLSAIFLDDHHIVLSSHNGDHPSLNLSRYRSNSSSDRAALTAPSSRYRFDEMDPFVFPLWGGGGEKAIRLHAIQRT